MNFAASPVIRLEDYQAPLFLIESINLTFDLGEDGTEVSSFLQIRRNGKHAKALVLDGKELELLSVSLDGKELDNEQIQVDDKSLTIASVPDSFTLTIHTRIHPETNTALEGLYKSSGNFCTQCEAQGFRHITYYIDRPDVMASFSTKIIADKSKYPKLLSNGNLVEQGELADGKHFALWKDPFKKPAYLFALVAGNLACVEDSYITKSGRSVALKFYVEHGNENTCAYAIESLKRAMKWDEQVFGLEYDLDIYMVVAVGDFNMGAMENKGLNIFNTKYVLADEKVATDGDLKGIEGVIGHEYFHNWTGNRVTCRDWFQLSLKEGLTVFRDQEFSADMNSRAVKRIEDVRILRATQFAEDKGPFAHPVRPDSYQEINNFYTTTVYNKGAEVIRMMHTILGAQGFRKGMDLYFERNDGQAVTCDDFAQAMQDANEVDLSQFKRWYWQAGTPVLDIKSFYDKASQTFTLSIAQSCPATPNQAFKEPFHIPLSVALIDKNGQEIEGTARVLHIKHEHELFVFGGIEHKAVPSLLRGFSAPVTVNYDYTDNELLHLLKFDTDSFNRWEAGQRFATKLLLEMVSAHQNGNSITIPKKFTDALGSLLNDEESDPELISFALSLPAESFIADKMSIVDVDAIHHCRQELRRHIAKSLRSSFEKQYQRHLALEQQAGNKLGAGAKNRALKNVCLVYLATLGDEQALNLCALQYKQQPNMTNKIAALACLVEFDNSASKEALANYYAQFKNNALAMDKWFMIQAQSPHKQTLQRVQELEKDPCFSLKNPNKVRSLIGAFCAGNAVNFHAASGEGYQFLADRVIALDAFNPQIAARMVQPLSDWRRYDAGRQQLMKDALQKILQSGHVSVNTGELVSKSLA